MILSENVKLAWVCITNFDLMCLCILHIWLDLSWQKSGINVYVCVSIIYHLCNFSWLFKAFKITDTSKSNPHTYLIILVFGILFWNLIEFISISNQWPNGDILYHFQIKLTLCEKYIEWQFKCQLELC